MCSSPAPLKWRRQFTTEWAPLGTTGGTLWEAGFVLADFLEATGAVAAAARCANTRGSEAKLLELGSGCGWLGICVAANHPDVDVHLTDQEEEGQLAWTEHNVELSGVRESCGARCTTLPLDWVTGNPDVEANCYDLIFGSDLVYNEAGVELLPLLLKRLLVGSKTRFLYAHTRYRYEDADMTFYQNIAAQGLLIRECYADGTEAPPTSPLPMTQVFPEKRIAIFEILHPEAQPDWTIPRCTVLKKGPTDSVVFDDSE